MRGDNHVALPPWFSIVVLVAGEGLVSTRHVDRSAGCGYERTELFDFCGDAWADAAPPTGAEGALPDARDFTATLRASTGADDCTAAWSLDGADTAFRCVDCRDHQEQTAYGAYKLSWAYKSDETDVSGCAGSWVAELTEPADGFETRAEALADDWNRLGEAGAWMDEFGFGTLFVGELRPLRGGFEYNDGLDWHVDPETGGPLLARYRDSDGVEGCEAVVEFR